MHDTHALNFNNVIAATNANDLIMQRVLLMPFVALMRLMSSMVVVLLMAVVRLLRHALFTQLMHVIE